MCMADYNDDPATVYSSKECRSRKDRKCDECSRKIAIGERYQNTFMVYDGRGSTWITCEHCVVGMRWLADNCGGFLHGAVWEDVHEHVREYPTLAPYLMRLVVGHQRQWKRFDRAGLMRIPSVPPTLESVGLGH